VSPPRKKTLGQQFARSAEAARQARLNARQPVWLKKQIAEHVAELRRTSPPPAPKILDMAARDRRIAARAVKPRKRRRVNPVWEFIADIADCCRALRVIQNLDVVPAESHDWQFDGVFHYKHNLCLPAPRSTEPEPVARTRSTKAELLALLDTIE
jgi:hypothetical protein